MASNGRFSSSTLTNFWGSGEVKHFVITTSVYQVSRAYITFKSSLTLLNMTESSKYPNTLSFGKKQLCFSKRDPEL